MVVTVIMAIAMVAVCALLTSCAFAFFTFAMLTTFALATFTILALTAFALASFATLALATVATFFTAAVFVHNFVALRHIFAVF